jgi:hypothetical protein
MEASREDETANCDSIGQEDTRHDPVARRTLNTVKFYIETKHLNGHPIWVTTHQNFSLRLKLLLILFFPNTSFISLKQVVLDKISVRNIYHREICDLAPTMESNGDFTLIF